MFSITFSFFFLTIAFVVNYMGDNFLKNIMCLNQNYNEYSFDLLQKKEFSLGKKTLKVNPDLK